MKEKSANKKTQEARTKNRNRLPPPEVKGLGMFSPEIDKLERPAAPNEAVRVRIDLIDVPEHIQRRPLNVGKVKDIAVTLRAGGSVNAVTLLPKEGGRYELETGRHRLEAHREAGFAEVPAIIQSDTDPARVAFRRTVENHMRRSISPYEEALDYEDMVAAKWSVEDLSRSLNVPVATIKGRLRLLALPMEIGMRIGEQGFPLSHAEILVPLAPHPKLLAVASKAIGQLDFDKRPLTVHGFQEAVEKELRGQRLVKDLETYHVRELVGRHPELKKRLAKLPQVKLGTGHWSKAVCIDPKGYRQAVTPFQIQDKAEAEKQRLAREKAEQRRRERGEEPAPDDYQERQRRQTYVQAYVLDQHAQRIARSAKACLGLDDALIGLVVRDAFHALARTADPDREGRILAEAVGATRAGMAALLGGADADVVAKRDRFVQRLLENPDRLPLARFLTVVTLLRSEDRWGPDWPVTTKTWLGIDGKVLEADAVKAYAAWVKAGAQDALPGQQRDDVDADEPVEASTTEVPPDAAAEAAAG